ncbi:hypothetical protein HZA97_04985 [Candidatus Woesearchaeota archaeon]|nr:hypothetical protein [Candidatus Woesearchaeota archaeon]
MQGNFEYQGLDKAEVEFFKKYIGGVPLEAQLAVEKKLTLREELEGLKGIDFIVTQLESIPKCVAVGLHQGPLFVVKPKNHVVEYKGGFYDEEGEKRISPTLLHAAQSFIYVEYPQGFFVNLYFDPNAEIID